MSPIHFSRVARTEGAKRWIAAVWTVAGIWIGFAVAAAPLMAAELLKPRTPADLAALQIAHIDPRRARPVRTAVSDFALSLGPGAAVALEMANGALPARARFLFQVRLLIVAGGRLHAGAVASCGAWSRDVSPCAIDCDGGQFRLRRSPGAGIDGLDLVFGQGPEDDPTGARDGLALAACGFDGGGESRLVAAPGRTVVELPLMGD